MFPIHDISSIFWKFIDMSITQPQEVILTSEEYKRLSEISRCQYNSFFISFDTLWFDESDIIDLEYPPDSLKYFRSDMHGYVFPDIQKLFDGVYKLYEIIEHSGLYSLNNKSYACSCKYNDRFAKLKKCIDKINFYNDLNDQLEKINSITL